MAETGFSLVVTKEMLDKIQKADHLITNLATKSEQAEKRIISAFTEMGQKGVGAFINKLNEAQNKIASLNNIKIQGADFSQFTNNAAQAIDSVNKLATIITKIETISTRAQNNSKGGFNLFTQDNTIEAFEEELTSLWKKLDDTSMKLFGLKREWYTQEASRSGFGEDIKNTTQEADKLMSQIQRMQTFLNGIKGQSAEAFGAMIKSMHQSDFELVQLNQSLRDGNSLLQKQTELWQQSYQAKNNSSKKQVGYEEQIRAYEKMFDKIIAKEEEQTRIANEKAKQRTEQAKQGYEEQLRAYEQMFDKIHQKEQKQDLDAYNAWLKQKDKERQVNEQVEDEKYKRQKDNAYKAYREEQERQSRLLEEYRKQNERARDSVTTAPEAYRQTLKMYVQMFDEIDKKRQADILKASQAYDKIAQQVKQRTLEEERAVEQEALANKRKAEQVIKNYQDEVKAARKAYAERQRMYEELFAQQAKEQSKARRDNYERYTSSYEGAMRLSGKADTINKELIAIKKLEIARNSLSKTDSQYEQKLRNINTAIIRHKKNIDAATASTKNLQGSYRGVMNISEQLTRRLALVFSVSQITGYVNKLISVRGEFELQQRALQAILQNKEEADRLWDKTIQLAVQSPFQVKELVTYTKQLAAYRVESEKLYDTTKMLADVSAGLGVDMQRLILAFGQVKAANYLRGTELRQFSEAGINILGELATYFSELEGITVSVGEVFERVSKRMVTFSDVEEIFKRLTSAGGTFYRMQEIQAETLRGQISNLRDSIDIMLNEVGKANERTLKNSVALVRSFVESWERIVDILQAAGAAYIVVTAARIKDAIAIKAWSAANISATASSKGLNAVLAKTIIGLRALWTALMNNPITAAIAGLTALGVVLYKVAKRNVEANRALQESANKLAMQRIESEKYTNILITLVKKENELVEANKSLNKESSQYKNNVSKINELEQERKNILNNLESVDATYAKNLREIGTDTEKLIEKTNLYNEELRVRIALEKDLQNISSEDFIKDYNTTTAELNTNAARVETTYENTIAKVEQLLDMPIGDGAKKVFNDFLNSSEPYIDRVTKLYETLSYNFRGLMGNFDFKDVQAYIKSIEEVDEITKKVVDDISKTATTYKATPRGSTLIGVITNAEATDKDIENAKNNIITTFEKILDDKAITGYLRTKAQETLSNIFNFKWEKINATKPLEEWKVAYNDFIATLDQERGARIAPATLDTTLEQLRSDIDSQIATLEKSIAAYDKANEKLKKALKTSFEKDTTTLANLKKQRDFLGYNPKETTSVAKDNTWTNLMRVVKEVNTEFKNLNKTFDKTTALQGTLAKYSDALTTAFEGTGKAFTDFDFTTESGLIAFYDWLIKVIPEVDKLKAQLAKGEVVWDVRINEKELEDKSILDQIEEMFSGYEVSLELQKLNIPPDIAKQLFNIDSLTLPQLKDEIIKLKPQFEGQDMLNEWDKLMKRINDMEVEAQEERLKTYSKYLVKAQGERVKIKLEELKQLAEIEKLGIDKPLKDEMRKGVKQETQSKLDAQAWEDFQGSDLYLTMFEDMENLGTKSIIYLKEQLEGLKDSLKHLPADQVRAIVKEIERLEEMQVERNPFKFFKDAREDVKNFDASYKELENKFLESSQSAKNVDDEINRIETVLGAMQDGTQYESSFLQDNIEYIALGRDELLRQRDALIIISKEQKKNAKEAREGMSAYEKMANGADAVAKEVQKWGEAFNQALDSIDVILDAFGVAEDDTSRLWIENIKNIASMIVQVVVLTAAMVSLGIATKSSMGIIGYILMALEAVAMILSTIFGSHDNKLQKQIERELELVEKLEKQYERLEEAINNAYSINTLESSQKSAERNIKSQISAYERMIKLEQDKKKTDKDQIKEWQDAIDDLNKQRKELSKDILSGLGGVTESDYRSNAREFVDAWVDAYKDAGSGLSGLQDNFSDFFNNILAEQAALEVSSRFLAPFYQDIEKALEDSRLTGNEADELKRKFNDIMPQMNDFLNEFFESIGGLADEGGELSGLQKGIQSVTEETAQVIEAYLNSVRFYVADSNMKLTTLVNSFTSEEAPNPILAQLRIIAQQTTAIHTLLDSLTTPHPTLSGRGLKVVL